MPSQRVPWEDGRWSSEPRAVRRVGDDLLVTAVPGSDFWERTLYGFQHRSGHALLAPWDVEQAVEVTFLLDGFTELYDQAGLILWRDDTHWIKAGVELNDGVPQVGAVVTAGVSDWSLAPVADWSGEPVTIRASQRADAVIIRARGSGHPWRTIRVAPFGPGDDLAAGPFLCAPNRPDLTVTFTGWLHTEPDRELHLEADLDLVPEPD